MPPSQTRSIFAEFRSPTSLACFVLVAALGLAMDLWSKHASWDRLVEKDSSGAPLIVTIDEAGSIRPVPREDIVVIPNVLELTAVANQGAAMGLGQGKQMLFVVVSIAAVGVLIYFFAHSGGRRFYQVVLGLLLAGVLGNLYDRIVFRFVRDMFHIFPGTHWSDLHGSLPGAELFPWVFNVADVFLCIGVPAVLIYGMFASPEAQGGFEVVPNESSGEEHPESR